jgi:hypothetical protein
MSTTLTSLAHGVDRALTGLDASPLLNVIVGSMQLSAKVVGDRGQVRALTSVASFVGSRSDPPTAIV